MRLEVLDYLALQDLREILVSPDPKELKVKLETLDSMDKQACLELKAFAVGLVVSVYLDHQDLLVCQVYEVQMVAVEALVCKVKRVLSERQERQDQWV